MIILQNVKIELLNAVIGGPQFLYNYKLGTQLVEYLMDNNIRYIPAFLLLGLQNDIEVIKQNDILLFFLTSLQPFDTSDHEDILQRVSARCGILK